MKRNSLIASVLFVFSSATSFAQCPITPPAVCLPLTGVPIVSGIGSLLLGSSYCVNSTTVISGTIQVVSGSTLYNNANLQATGLAVQTPGGLVLCSGSTINVDNLTLSAINAITAPNTAAQLCILVNNTLNASALQSNLGSNVHFCLAPGATVLNGSNLGSATVTTNCTACGIVPLPIQLISFSGAMNNGSAMLQWRAYEDAQALSYKVQRMNGDGAFMDIQQIPATMGSGENTYSFAEPLAMGQTYYRIALVNVHGTAYSNVVRLSPNTGSNYVVQYAGTVLALRGAFDQDKPISVTAFDVSGRQLETVVLHTGDKAPSALPAGTYFLHLTQNSVSESARIVVP